MIKKKKFEASSEVQLTQQVNNLACKCLNKPLQRALASTQCSEHESEEIMSAPVKGKATSCSILVDLLQIKISEKMRSLWQEVDKVIQ